MTAAEFKSWCLEAAAEFGYTVEVGGLGSLPPSTIDHLTDEENREVVYATSTAIFRLGPNKRRGSRRQAPPVDEDERSPRSAKTSVLPFFHPSTAVHPHSKIATHFYPAHPAAGDPLSDEDIRAVVKVAMQDKLQSGETTLGRVWSIEEVAIACGGSLQALVDALGDRKVVDEAFVDELKVRETGFERGAEDLTVIFSGFVPLSEEEMTTPGVGAGGGAAWTSVQAPMSSQPLGS